MKRSVIAAAVFSTVLMSSGVFAADQDYGELTITGMVKGSTCQFMDGNTSTVITMNDVGLDVFSNLTPGDIYTGLTNSTNSPLKVHCAAGTDPKITLSTDQFDDTHQNITKNTGGDAENIGFAVKANGEELSPGNTITLTEDSAGSGNYTIDFSAQYALTGATPSAGSVKSTVKLTVVTD